MYSRSNFGGPLFCFCALVPVFVSVATPAEPRGEKKTFFFLCKFWAVKNF